MNSLFAYIGDKACKALLLQGIQRCPVGALSGIALKTGKGIVLCKAACPAATLQQQLASSEEDGCIGIATVSTPQQLPFSEETAAPYALNTAVLAADGNLNAEEAKVLLATLTATAEGDILPAMKKQLKDRQGSMVLLAGKEQCLYCRAGTTPLYIAIAEHGFFVTDTFAAIPDEAVRFHLLKKGESAKITRERVVIFDARLHKMKKPLLSSESARDISGSLFPDGSPLSFPLSVKASVNRFIKDGLLVKENVCPLGRSVQRITQVILTGSGSAYYAAKMAAAHFLTLADLSATAYESNELALSNLLMDKGTLLIAVSDSGRDDAAAECLERAKRLGAVTVAVTENPYSQLAVTAAAHLAVPPGNTLVNAGLALSFLALYIGNRYEVISDIYLSVSVQLATMLTGKVSTAVKTVPPLQNLSGKISHAGAIITAGVGTDTATAATAAAILRRVLQLPAGTESLHLLSAWHPSLLRNTLVLSFLTDSELLPSALPPLYRLQHSGAEVVLITTESIAAELPDILPAVAYPDSVPLFNPLICLAGFTKICTSATELPTGAAI